MTEYSIDLDTAKRISHRNYLQKVRALLEMLGNTLIWNDISELPDPKEPMQIYPWNGHMKVKKEWIKLDDCAPEQGQVVEIPAHIGDCVNTHYTATFLRLDRAFYGYGLFDVDGTIYHSDRWRPKEPSHSEEWNTAAESGWED